jgi:hypothetical protein
MRPRPAPRAMRISNFVGAANHQTRHDTVKADCRDEGRQQAEEAGVGGHQSLREQFFFQFKLVSITRATTALSEDVASASGNEDRMRCCGNGSGAAS